MTLNEQIARVLAIPEEIYRLERTLTRHRAEKRETEDNLKRRAAEVRVRARARVEFQQIKGAAAQEDYLLLAVCEDTDYEEYQKRLRQLQVAIDKTEADIEALRREHQSLRAALEGHYARLLEQVFSDRQLAEFVAKHGSHAA